MALVHMGDRDDRGAAQAAIEAEISAVRGQILEEADRNEGTVRAFLIAVQSAFLNQTTDIGSLIRRAGVRRNHLYAKFGERVGPSPAKYVLMKRLEVASRLLGTSSLEVQEIAALAGFPDARALARALKREMGRSPGEERDRLLRAASEDETKDCQS